MECNIPANPNPFLKYWLMSPQCVAVMREAGTITRDLYRGIVAHRSGALAESARVSFGLGGLKNDRIIAEVTVGEGTPRGGYGASHEFGIGIHPESRVPPTNWMPQEPVDDLVRVLAILDSM